MTLAEFRRAYPTATFTVSGGKPFTYRYYKNPQAKVTLVLLTGGIGLSDLFYQHFARFAGDFSVLTFDYQIQFGNHGEFADAVAELFRHLKEKVWLVGQSLGGVVAQVIASRHPEVVEGLILLILSEDDTTFTPVCREDLIALMSSPTVVTDLCGGHLALMVRLDEYADLVTKFILERTPRGESAGQFQPALYYLSISISHDQAVDGKWHIPRRHKQCPIFLVGIADIVDGCFQR